MRRKNFYSEMRRLHGVLRTKRSRQAAETWLVVKNLLVTGFMKGIWGRQQELAGLLLDGYKTEIVALKMGLSEDSVNVRKKELSDRLYEIFGEDFFSLMEDYEKHQDVIKCRVATARVDLTMGDDFLIKQYPIDVINIINIKVSQSDISTDFSIVDCAKEISYLSKFNKINMQSEIESVDPNRLSFIMGIIEGTKGTKQDRYDLFDKLNILEMGEK